MSTNAWGNYIFTNDGGASWEARPVSQIQVGGLGEIAYVSSNQAWALANGVLYSTDSGRTWTKVLDGDFYFIKYVPVARCLFVVGSQVSKYKLP